MLTNRLEIRKLKSHFRLRWYLYRHNLRYSNDKLLMLDDKFILKNIIPGPVQAVDCLSDVYKDILPMASTGQPVSNVLIINPLSFLYSSPDDIVNKVVSNTANLVRPGRLIVNLNMLSIIYDRLNVSRETLCQIIITGIQAQGFVLVDRLNRFSDFTHGYGHLFLSFDRE